MRALAVLIVLAGCADDLVVEVGVIEHYGEAPDVIDAPATAHAGETVDLRVTTFGGGCIESAFMDVDVGVANVDLTPYDSHPADAICTADLRYLTHETTVTLDAPGTWTIRVHGRRLDGRGEALIEQVHAIIVR